MKKTALLFSTAFLFLMASCSSLQRDISISAEDTEKGEQIIALEKRLISFDCAYILNNGKLPEGKSKELAVLKKDIDSELSQSHLDKVVVCRLLALKGRALILDGKNGEAAKIAVQAEKKFNNDVQLMILKRRLNIIEDTDLFKDKFDSDTVMIEDAIEHFSEGEFDVASGLFDQVFVNPDSMYKSAYQPLREKAWKLRNIETGEKAQAIWAANEMSVLQMMECAQNQAGLLEFYTAGAKMDSKKLYQTLIKAGLMESASKTQTDENVQKKNGISENTKATRILAARFLWNLYSTRNSILKTKYSDKYRSRENARSPVADVTLENEDFDAVIGTVENEIMSLTDGKNFSPEKSISATDFDTCVKKIK